MEGVELVTTTLRQCRGGDNHSADDLMRNCETGRADVQELNDASVGEEMMPMWAKKWCLGWAKKWCLGWAKKWCLGWAKKWWSWDACAAHRADAVLFCSKTIVLDGAELLVLVLRRITQAP